MKRRDFNKGLAAATAVSMSPFSLARNARAAANGGATLVFGYPNGFANVGGAIYMGEAQLSGSDIQLCIGNGHHSACAFYKTKQPPTAFTTQFTFKPTGLGSPVAQSGLTFMIQNVVSPPGQPGVTGYVYGGDANMCGYGGAINQYPPQDSIAIKFDAGDNSAGQNFPNGGCPSSTGMYFNGGPSVYPHGSLGLCPSSDLNPYGINFYNGSSFAVTIVYDGSLLTMVLLDTTTNAQARFVWPLNLANTTNPDGNYVGFTAGTAAIGQFHIQTWNYWSGYNTRLATPTFSPTPGQYPGTQTVAITFPPGSTCYYTTNGLLPTSSSTQYTGPITVSSSAVIQAVAIQSGYTDSLVGTGAYQINTSNVINFPSGFSSSSLITVGYAYLNGSAINLTDTKTSTAGAAWFPIPVTVTSFSTSFVLLWGSSGQGMCFVIQNNPPAYPTASNAINWSGGPTVVGASSGGMGYGGMNALNGTPGQSFGILNSVAISFNQYPGPDPANGVGLYTNGANPYGSQIATGLNYSSGHPFNVSLSYSGNTLSLSMTDTVTGATFSHNFTIDIPTTVGGGTAYVGFTGGTGGASSVQSVESWTYTASAGQAAPVPAAPTNLSVK